jgi:hypothetical protein
MTTIDWPNALVTDNDEGVPLLAFRETDTGAIGYGHQVPDAFAKAYNDWIEYQMGEDYDPESAKTSGHVNHLWVIEVGDWLEECEERTPDCFPVTVIGSL